MDTFRIRRLLRRPWLVPRVVLSYVAPNHERFGRPWFRLPTGYISFRERGFVEAASPSSLLARHNYEVLCIRRLLNGTSIGTSLEVGCGYGRLTPVLAGIAKEHVAIDVNRRALKQAHKAYPDYRFQVASVTELPFWAACFDFVTTWTVLQHVGPGEIAGACSELVRVLAPGGTLLICEEMKARAAEQQHRSTHTWPRHVTEYAALLSQLDLIITDPLSEISRLPGMRAPGTVALWRKP